MTDDMIVSRGGRLRRALATQARSTPFLYGAALTAARMLPVLAVFLASHLLGAAEFGSLAVLVTSVTVASLLADSGTDNAAGWAASHVDDTASARRILAALVQTRLFVATCATVALAAPQLTYIPGSAAAHALMLALAVAGNCLASFNAAKRIELRIAGAGEPRALLVEKLGVSLLFTGWLLVSSPSSLSVVWGYLGASVIGPLFAMQPVSRADFRTSIRDIRGLLGHAAPFIVTTLCSAAIWRLATFVLAHSEKLAQAGYLTLAYYPVQALSTIPNLSAPLLLIRGNQRRLSMRRSMLIGLAMGILLTSLALLSTLLIHHTFLREVFAPDATSALRVLLLALPFLWLNPMLVSYLRLRSGPWSPTVAHVMAGAGALAVTAAVVPKHGATAAAGVIAGAEAVVALALIALVLVTRRSFGAGRP